MATSCPDVAGNGGTLDRVGGSFRGYSVSCGDFLRRESRCRVDVPVTGCLVGIPQYRNYLE